MALAFSGGKDSVAALHRLSRDPDVALVALVTTFNRANHRIALHGTPLTLIESQARAFGLPLLAIALEEHCDNAAYLGAFADGIRPLLAEGLDALAFGDLHLQDIRQFRESQCDALGIQALFPLWGRDPAALAVELIDWGLDALLCGVDLACLPESWLGRRYDSGLLAELPPGVDPCGERGEFHTFVRYAPGMRFPVPVRTGTVHISHRRYGMLDLQPA
ncbi:MAG: ATPase [Wenzhouxiangellaceae bacterium]